MDILDSLLLGILQGVTEFLPISSSGHLVLGEEFLGLEVADLKAFDVIVHLATLLAIIVYFWRDVVGLILAFFRAVSGRLRKGDPYGELVLWIVIGTVPAVIVGVTLEDWIDGVFRNAEAVAGVMIVMSGVFLVAEWIYQKRGRRNLGAMKWWMAVLVGVAQAVALIPGVSRSGSTISAGIAQGVERRDAAKFSFLLGIPAMIGAGLLTGLDIADHGIQLGVTPLLVGFLSAFLAGLASVWFLMKFLKRHSLAVFAVYLAAVGAAVLIL